MIARRISETLIRVPQVYRSPRFEKSEPKMIVLGVILLILGLLIKIPILTTIGIILLVIGAVLFLLGSVGRPIAGRRHYW
jgi:uncharacterized membrane protein HdeD (DUF308 family)